MYFRPEMTDQQFVIESRTAKRDKAGHVVMGYEVVGTVFAVLGQATPREIERYKRLGHPITHTIVSHGGLRAKPGDRLVHKNRVFYIQGADNVGDFSHFSLYYAEERCDDNG